MGSGEGIRPGDAGPERQKGRMAVQGEAIADVATTSPCVLRPSVPLLQCCQSFIAQTGLLRSKYRSKQSRRNLLARVFNRSISCLSVHHLL